MRSRRCLLKIVYTRSTVCWSDNAQHAWRKVNGPTKKNRSRRGAEEKKNEKGLWYSGSTMRMYRICLLIERCSRQFPYSINIFILQRNGLFDKVIFLSIQLIIGWNFVDLLGIPKQTRYQCVSLPSSNS